MLLVELEQHSYSDLLKDELIDEVKLLNFRNHHGALCRESLG